MASFKLFLLALASLLLSALAQVKTEVGPLDYTIASMFPNLNLDGVASQSFLGIMQDKDNAFLAIMGGTTIIKFSPGSNVASLVAGLGASTAEGIQATSTRLLNGYSLAGDTVGNIYYSEQTSRHCIRRIGLDGVVNTFAGTCGSFGPALDNVAATSSSFSFAFNIFYHTQTNCLYIADSGNSLIRMVSISTNIITTVMGSTQGNTINVVATSVRMNQPVDVWVDSNGVMYVADYVNRRILRAASPSAIVTSFTASGSAVSYPTGTAATSANIGQPTAVTGDTSGNIYIVGVGSSSTSVTYRCTTSNTVFSYPQSATSGVIHNEAFSNFYFAGINRILLSKDGKLTVSASGTGAGYIAQFPTTFDATSTVSVIAGYSSSSTKSIPATSMMFRTMDAIWSDTNGALYVVDATSFIIVKSSGGMVTSVAGTRLSNTLPAGSTAVAISYGVPASMASIVGDRAGNLYYSHQTGVHKISSTGILSVAAGTNVTTGCAATWNYAGAATSVNLCATRGLALSTAGELYLADDAYVIRRLVLSTGFISTIVGRGVQATATSPVGFVSSVFGLWLDEPRSSLYATDFRNVVLRINLADSNPNSTVSVYAGRLGATSNAGDYLPATSSGLNGPRGICGTSNGDVYITQLSQFYIRVVFAASQVMRFYVGTGVQGEGNENTVPLSTPVVPVVGCFVDDARNKLYYAQSGSTTGSVRSSSPLAIGSIPSCAPSPAPTFVPTTLAPSGQPTVTPSLAPSCAPSVTPSQLPSVFPSITPSMSPSETPSALPSVLPTVTPSQLPTAIPTLSPSSAPSISPSDAPSAIPSQMPSAAPTASPSVLPSATPTESPSCLPTVLPTMSPSAEPSVAPSQVPSVTPTLSPSVSPTVAPSMQPTVSPSVSPSEAPSTSPSVEPSASPTVQTTSTVKFQSTWAFKLNNNGKSATAAETAGGVLSSRLRIRDLVPYALSVVDQQAIVLTQAAYLQTSPDNIVYVSAQEDDVALIVYATTQVTLHLVDYPELNNNGTQLFQQATSILTEAVQSGSFVAALVTKAAEMNSTSFSSAVVTVVLFSDPTVIPAPNYDVVDGGLTVGQVAGLVVGTIVGTLFLMLGVYWAFVLMDRRKKRDKDQQHSGI